VGGESSFLLYIDLFACLLFVKTVAKIIFSVDVVHLCFNMAGKNESDRERVDE
jgi:hypothetical protein